MPCAVSPSFVAVAEPGMQNGGHSSAAVMYASSPSIISLRLAFAQPMTMRG